MEDKCLPENESEIFKEYLKQKMKIHKKEGDSYCK